MIIAKSKLGGKLAWRALKYDRRGREDELSTNTSLVGNTYVDAACHVGLYFAAPHSDHLNLTLFQL